MPYSFKARMARTMVLQEDPNEVMALVDAVLPAVVDVLSKPQLKVFVRRLFEHHLETLLRDMSREERAALLREVMPVIVREFPLDEVSLTATELSPPESS